MPKTKLGKQILINLLSIIKIIKEIEDLSNNQCLWVHTTFKIHKSLWTTDLIKTVQFRLIIRLIKIWKISMKLGKDQKLPIMEWLRINLSLKDLNWFQLQIKRIKIHQNRNRMMLDNIQVKEIFLTKKLPLVHLIIKNLQFW